jgi:hypothetical protein
VTSCRQLAYICLSTSLIAICGCGNGPSAVVLAKTTNNASTLSLATSSLPSAVSNTEYSAAINVTGGTPGYTFSIAAGTLPAGLSLQPTTGTISGIPTGTGTSNVTILVKDSGNPVQTQSASMTVSVLPKLLVTTAATSSDIVGNSYSAALAITGGVAPYSASIISGALPQGLTFSPASETISGNPRATGTFNLTFAVTDSGAPTQSQQVSMTLNITQAPSPLALQISGPATAAAGQTVQVALDATGGTPSYDFKLASGTLPSGLSIDNSTGQIKGTPAGSGISKFVVAVNDHSSPQQTTSASMSMTIIPALTITLPPVPSGQVGIPYSLGLPAVGGLSAYVFTVSSGSLPQGLSVNSSTGMISGTPLSAGDFSFGLTVSDALPGQIATIQLSISIAAAPVGTTWYVRADGGTRYSGNNPQGQCDGKADAAYSGTGVNQHCAFGDYRFLYDDQHTYPAPSASTWAIAGGDTVIIDNTKQWRVGHDQGASSNDPWCSGTGASICYNPTVPSGTALQHTRILGRNYASCKTSDGRANHALMTQLYGGFGVGETLNLTGAKYVDVECIEVSSYTNCVVHGSPNPMPCNTSFPLSDYAQDGVEIDSTTSNLQLQDMYVHSVAAYGVHGNIANPITMTRVDVAYTGATGINLDDGTEADSPNGILTFNYGSIQFAGCAPEYPAVHAIPVTYCFDQNSGNNGDGLGTANVSGLDMHFDHDIFAYNTEDCIDPGHVYYGTHTLTLTNNVAYGCQGASFKWGSNFTNVTVQNNIAISNCARMSAPLSGAPATYNQYLSLFCRAGDATSFNFLNGGIADVENNTFIGTSSILFDIACTDTSCAKTLFTFRNNIVRAYADTTSQGSYNGGAGPAGLTYSGPAIGNIVEDHDIFFGPMRNQSCSVPTVPCEDPQFSSEPAAFADETTLDALQTSLAPQSPAVGAGIPVSGLLLDITGAPFAAPPSLGALEKGSVAPSSE